MAKKAEEARLQKLEDKEFQNYWIQKNKDIVMLLNGHCDILLDCPRASR